MVESRSKCEAMEIGVTKIGGGAAVDCRLGRFGESLLGQEQAAPPDQNSGKKKRRLQYSDCIFYVNERLGPQSSNWSV